ncbi:MAG: J domain-containing protein [Chloroflexi bacterium]|nr:J domain-containing protein [Chloroflexota bacterium]
MTTTQGPDPYVVLGIDPAADRRAVRKAYHAKARANHPDLGGDDRTMTRLNAAYDLLKDPRKRAAFDAHRTPSDTARAAGAPPWTGAAGPPPGRPSGPVLDFGLFAGWSLGEIARRDAGYLVWLSERKEGKPYLEAIERIVAPLREASRLPVRDKPARR